MNSKVLNNPRIPDRKHNYWAPFFLLMCCSVGCLAATCQRPKQAIVPARDSTAIQYWLFAYFLEEKGGLQYAISIDGLHWKPIHSGHPILKPGIEKKLFRDPSIIKGKDQLYHLVWTTGWSGQVIGYSSSSDLIHWSKQASLALMKDIPHVVNCWAPELFYDSLSEQYIIYWSSTLSDNGVYADGKNFLFYSLTKDFISFTPPKVLFTNQQSGGGQEGKKGVIDGYIYQQSGRYLLFYKKDDNSGVANLFFRTSTQPTGGWSEEQGPLLPSTGDEGPTCIKIGNDYFLYTDPMESHQAYVFITRDFKNWRKEKTDLTMSHGSVMAISEKEEQMLMNKQKTTAGR